MNKQSENHKKFIDVVLEETIKEKERRESHCFTQKPYLRETIMKYKENQYKN